MVCVEGLQLSGYDNNNECDFTLAENQARTTQSTGLASVVSPTTTQEQPVQLTPTIVELSSTASIEPEVNVPNHAHNLMFHSNPAELIPGAPHIVAQAPEAPHHVPYLMNQAQMQFALMEQQYEQQVQQEQQHQKELSNQSTDYQFAMDMGDSDTSSMQLQPEDLPTEETSQSVNQPRVGNELIDFSSEDPIVALSSLPNVPSIPISHSLAGNAYPSLTNPVPIGIAQSFAPMYVQPQLPTQQGGDIYTDYVQNPYNLVLHPIDQQHQPIAEITTSEVSATSTTTTTSTPPIANVFQSANYFGIDQSARIPPGSEMLFSSP